MSSDRKIVALKNDSSIIIDTLPDEFCPDFKELLKLCPDSKNTIFIHGKRIEMPRYNRIFGEQYDYSSTDNKKEELTDPYLIKLLEYTNKINDNKNIIYNGILVNFYMDGTQYIGEHSDDEKQLVEGSNVYSFSFGTTRDFVVKSKEGNERYVYPLKDKTMIVMCGNMQKYYKHSVPKRLKVKEPRINITIRAFKK